MTFYLPKYLINPLVLVQGCIGQNSSAAITFLVQLSFLDLELSAFCIMKPLWEETLPIDENSAVFNTTFNWKWSPYFYYRHL